MNKLARFLRSPRTAVASVLAAAVASAHAELPAGAATAIAGVGTDVVNAIGLVIVAGISIYAAKKLGQKMGWL